MSILDDIYIYIIDNYIFFLIKIYNFMKDECL